MLPPPDLIACLISYFAIMVKSEKYFSLDRLGYSVNSVLGSVTNYDTKMENVQCPPSQHMVVKRADYGDFNNSGTFDNNTIIDTQCSALSNCQVKSHCGGKRSCELTMNNTLLPSRYCSDNSKEIYTEYTCVDSRNSNTTTSGKLHEILKCRNI